MWRGFLLRALLPFPFAPALNDGADERHAVRSGQRRNKIENGLSNLLDAVDRPDVVVRGRVPDRCRRDQLVQTTVEYVVLRDGFPDEQETGEYGRELIEYRLTSFGQIAFVQGDLERTREDEVFPDSRWYLPVSSNAASQAWM